MVLATACSIFNDPDEAQPPPGDSTSQATTGPGAGGAGGGATTTTTGVGGAGAAPTVEGKPSTGIVSAGSESSSGKYRMVFTVGPESGAATKSSSPKYDRRDGVVGATQGE